MNKTYFPLFLNLRDTHFLIVGAGNTALAKLESVLEFTDHVTILAPEAIAPMETVILDKHLMFIRDHFSAPYLEGRSVIIAATGDAIVNAAVAAEANRLGKLVNVVDDPEHSSFIFGANIRAGGLTVAISTSGLSPVLARLLKRNIHRALPPRLEVFNDFLVRNREHVRRQITNLQARRLFWETFFDGPAGEALATGVPEKAQHELERMLTRADHQQQAAIYVLGMGPGEADLLTLRSIRLLSRADTVLTTGQISADILAYTRREAQKTTIILTGDTPLAALLLEHATQGRIVALLLPGNPVKLAERLRLKTVAAGVAFRYVHGVDTGARSGDPTQTA